MHKRGIIRYANYTVCASVFIHFCMQRKNNENIPIIEYEFIFSLHISNALRLGWLYKMQLNLMKMQALSSQHNSTNKNMLYTKYIKCYL